MAEIDNDEIKIIIFNFVERLWEEDDGYFYRISGNYDEEDVEEKEYNLEVIDKMTKKYDE